MKEERIVKWRQLKRREKPKPFLGEVSKQKLEYYIEFTLVFFFSIPLILVCMTLRPVCFLFFYLEGNAKMVIYNEM